MSFNEWKINKLIDLCEKIGSGATPRGGSNVYLETGIPFIRSQNVYNCEFSKGGLVYIDEESAKKLDNVILSKNDVILNITGDSVARCTIIPEKYIGGRVNQHVAIIRANSKMLNSQFLKYFLVSPTMQAKMLSLARMGATRAALTKGMIESFQIPTPDIKEQEEIAHILSTLDEKIEVNNQINKTLENMAQAIFKQWFVDFEFPNEDGEPYKSSGGEMVESEIGRIPKGWEVKTLDDLTVKFTTGLNPRKNFVLGNGDNFYVTIKNMSNQQVILDDRCDKIDNQALRIINKRSDLKKGDILFSGIGTIGRTYVIDVTPYNWNISESIFTLRAYDERASIFLYQLLLSDLFQGYAKQLASGSVQKGIRMGDMKIFKLAYSESFVLNNYHKVMSNIVTKIKVLHRENTMLSSLRDSLLPKLMAGEIRVPLESEGDAS